MLAKRAAVSARRSGYLVTLLCTIGCGGGSDDGGTGGGGGGGAAGAGGSAGSSAGGSAGSSSGGGGSSSSLCDGIKGSCFIDEVSKCFEHGGTQGAETFTAFEQTCVDDKHVWSTGLCGSTGTVGTCVLSIDNGPCDTIVYYSPITAADAQTECEALANSSWVP